MAPPIQVAAPPNGSISVGMIVGFVLEQEQPWLLIMAIHQPHLHRAGVDFFDSSKILQNTVLLEPLRADGAHIP